MVNDHFNVNGASLGANWTDVVSGLFVSGNVAVMPNDGAGSRSAFYSAVSFTDTQTCGVTFVTVQNSSFGWGGPAVRFSNASGLNGYHILSYPASATIRLWKWVAGTQTEIASFSGTAVDGDIFELQVSGTTFKLFRNGTQVGTDQTDSGVSSGSGGIFLNVGGGGTSPQLDDWYATGDIAGAAAQVPYQPAYLLAPAGAY
jgi:hypothetical protein